MNVRHKAAAAAFGAAAATLVAVASPATAETASVTTDRVSASQSCVTLVSKELDANGNSKVLAKRCSQSEAAARSAVEEATSGALASSTLLVRLFPNPGYSGGYDGIYGDSGPCDSAGYRLNPGSYWGQVMSSIQGFNNCNTTRLWTISLNYARTFSLNAASIGNYDNNVGKMWVWRG